MVFWASTPALNANMILKRYFFESHLFMTKLKFVALCFFNFKDNYIN
jgi:hypothetical protein